MLCVASVRIGPARQAFWAVWDRRDSGRLLERTTLGRGGVRLAPGRAQVTRPRPAARPRDSRRSAGIETVCPSGRAYAWTRKQGGVRARGAADARRRAARACGPRGDRRHRRLLRAPHDLALVRRGRHRPRRPAAGLEPGERGQRPATPRASAPCGSTASRTSRRRAPSPPDLPRVDGLALRRPRPRGTHDENLLPGPQLYRQPFGTFSGALPGGVELAEGYGVMEAHDVWW